MRYVYCVFSLVFAVCASAQAQERFETAYPEPAGTVYYVSAAGDDASEGRSEATPVRTLSRAHALAEPGDQILLRAGDTFRPDQHPVYALQPEAAVLYGAYGPVADGRPVIAASRPGSGFAWRDAGGGVWSTVPGREVYNVWERGPGGSYYEYANSRNKAGGDLAWARADTSRTHYDGGTLYVHTSDGAAPDADVEVAWNRNGLYQDADRDDTVYRDLQIGFAAIDGLFYALTAGTFTGIVFDDLAVVYNGYNGIEGADFDGALVTGGTWSYNGRQPAVVGARNPGGGIGLQFDESVGVVVTGVTLDRNGSHAAFFEDNDYFTSWSGGVQFSGGTAGSVAWGNRCVSDPGVRGAVCYNMENAGSGNAFHHNTAYGGRWGAYVTQSGTGNVVAHNTFVAFAPPEAAEDLDALRSACIGLYGNAGPLAVKSNACASAYDGPHMISALVQATDGPESVNPGGNVAYLPAFPEQYANLGSGPRDYQDLAVWNAGAAAATDGSGDLLLGGPAAADFLPRSGSAAIQAGVEVEGITPAYSGAAPDAGAFQTGFGSGSLRVGVGAGWSLVALRICPNEQALAALFADAPALARVEDRDGRIYDPALGIDEIGVWDCGQAYKVYAEADFVLEVTGEPIPPETPLALEAGWNYVPYLLAEPRPVGEALGSVAAELVAAKDVEGRLFFPAYGIEELGLLLPNQGYHVHVSAATVLVY